MSIKILTKEEVLVEALKEIERESECAIELQIISPCTYNRTICPLNQRSITLYDMIDTYKTLERNYPDTQYALKVISELFPGHGIEIHLYKARIVTVSATGAMSFIGKVKIDLYA